MTSEESQAVFDEKVEALKAKFAAIDTEREENPEPFVLDPISKMIMENMDKMYKITKETILRIKQNDSTLKQLRIGDTNDDDSDEDNNLTMFDMGCIRDSNIGTYVKENTHLKALRLTGNLIFESQSCADHSEFYDGLKQNSSIHELSIRGKINNYPRRKDVGGVVQDVLQVYQENNSHLTCLDIRNVSFENGGDATITDTLSNCTNLTSIKIHRCLLRDKHVVRIVEAIRGHHALKDLRLDSNIIGLYGYHCIGTLLQDPNCHLRSLDLSTPYTFVLEFSRIQEIFIRALCNKSSINSTYLSSHTLAILKLPNGPDNLILSSLLRMNEGRNKSYIAIRKILEHHPNILADMQPFFADWILDDEQSLKALPLVIDWLNEAVKALLLLQSPRGKQSKHYSNIERKKLSAIYQFARAMPLMFVTNIDVTYIVQNDQSQTDTDTKREMMNRVALDKCCVIL